MTKPRRLSHRRRNITFRTTTHQDAPLHELVRDHLPCSLCERARTRGRTLRLAVAEAAQMVHGWIQNEPSSLVATHRTAAFHSLNHRSAAIQG